MRRFGHRDTVNECKTAIVKPLQDLAYGMRRFTRVLVLVGVPGIVLAIVLKLTVKEPPRGYSEEKTAETTFRMA